MIKVTNLSFSYGYGPVFEQVSFLVPRGKKVGLVGPNGAGKSTLFKILMKEEFPSEGKLEISGTVGWVPQEVKNDPLLQQAESIEAYVDPQRKHGAFKIASILDGLEFTRPPEGVALSQLSGGQKTKLALTRAFLEQPDTLLLDEPTNFLDEAGKRWVMHFLGKYPKSVIIISHDLSLLDRHISQVLSLNTHTHKLEVFTGNYSGYIRTKTQQDALLTRQVHIQQKKIASLEKSIQGLKRLTSDKGVRQRVVLERRVERMKDVLPEAPKELRGMKGAFPPPAKVGEVPLRAHRVFKSYRGVPVLRDVSIELRRGERLALIGPNGAGKTTLIKLLTGRLQPDAGEVIASDSLHYGYYSQEFQLFDENKTLEEVIREADRLPEHKIIPYLGKFLFPYERLHQRVAQLSGGEKTRLSIALLMLQEYNLLILDEPTTYLDVMSQRIILEALKQYTGSMLLVSHTREFVSELQPQRALLLPQNKTMIWSEELVDRVVEI